MSVKGWLKGLAVITFDGPGHLSDSALFARAAS